MRANFLVLVLALTLPCAVLAEFHVCNGVIQNRPCGGAAAVAEGGSVADVPNVTIEAEKDPAPPPPDNRPKDESRPSATSAASDSRRLIEYRYTKRQEPKVSDVGSRRISSFVWEFNGKVEGAGDITLGVEFTPIRSDGVPDVGRTRSGNVMYPPGVKRCGPLPPDGGTCEFRFQSNVPANTKFNFNVTAKNRAGGGPQPDFSGCCQDAAGSKCLSNGDVLCGDGAKSDVCRCR